MGLGRKLFLTFGTIVIILAAEVLYDRVSATAYETMIGIQSVTLVVAILALLFVVVAHFVMRRDD